MRRKYKFYFQRDSMDCGPTCLRIISKYYGKNTPIEPLRKLCEVGKEGVTLTNLGKAANNIGLDSVAVRLTFNQLVSEEVTKPCILHWNKSHFIVLTHKFNKRKLTVIDPARGILEMSYSAFLKNWSVDTTDGQHYGIALILEPSASFFKRPDDVIRKNGWLTVIKHIAVFKRQLFYLFVGLIFSLAIQLIFPFISKVVVDKGIVVRNLNLIQLFLIGQFILFITKTFIDTIRSRILLSVTTRTNMAVLSSFWTKLFKLPISFFDSRKTGDIIQRVNDFNKVETFVIHTFFQTIFSLGTLFIFSFILFSFDWKIFLIFILTSLSYISLNFYFLKFRRTIDYQRFELASKENSGTIQIIHGIHDIKLNNAENQKRKNWERVRSKILHLNLKALSINQIQHGITTFINEGKNILITYLVAESVVNGRLSLGSMLSIQYIIGLLSGPIEQITLFFQQYQDAKISLERLNEIHDITEEITVENAMTDAFSESKKIAFKNVEFKYPNSGDVRIFKNLNIEFLSGKVNAIVGVSGSGKTTVVKLIQQFYQNYKGDIYIGNKNLKSVNPKSLRAIMGSVMQDGYIFSDTIENNIVLDDREINYKSLSHACEVACISDFIHSLPLGLKTKIGVEGNGISAGQRQRILIARAVYKNPIFFLLDEATNALDVNTEKCIMEKLNSFFKGRTVIVIAHRLSTVRMADKIVVLSKGEVIEEGCHDELVNERGTYYDLVKNQLEFAEN